MGVPISSLPSATALTGAELIPVVQSGQTKQTTTDAMPFAPSGTGAVATTVQTAIRRAVVSVRDYATAQDAVNYAYTNGLILHWPDLVTVTGNITNFHAVKHIGPGGVVRGTDTFYADPKEGQENVLYVSPTGSDANDGLTAALPFATTQAAFNALTKRGYLDGTWRVKHAAGSYSGAAKSARLGPANETESTPNSDPYLYNGVVSKNYISVEGPDVGYDPATNPWPTPTAIFDGGNTAAVGLQLEKVKVLVKNLKFLNYNGSTSSGGIVGDGTLLRTENVHTSGCYYGITNFRGLLEVRGGDLYGSATKQYIAIRSMFLNKHEIGSQGAGAIGQGPRIRYCSQGILAQEGATGHSDYVQYEDCSDGIRVTVNSRVNFGNSDFKRCTRGVRADANSVIFYISPNFNAGTADACTENIVIQQNGVDIVRDTYANTVVATDYLTSSVTVTGTLTSIAIITKTLPKGLFAPVLSSIRKPQHIRITGFGSISGTASTKQMKIRIGTTAFAISASATDTGSFKFTGELLFLSPTLQKGGVSFIPHLSTTRSNYGSAAIDMAASDQNLTVEVQLTNAGDSVTFDHCVIEVFG